MPFNIADGSYTSADALQPYDPAASPGVAPPTPVSGLLTPADQGGVMPTTAMFAEQAAAGEADARAAQAAGMDARNAMLAHYAADVLPVGAAYGDDLALPVVPEDANGPAADFLFAEGDQPGKGT